MQGNMQSVEVEVNKPESEYGVIKEASDDFAVNAIKNFPQSKNSISDYLATTNSKNANIEMYEDDKTIVDEQVGVWEKPVDYVRKESDVETVVGEETDIESDVETVVGKTTDAEIYNPPKRTLTLSKEQKSEAAALEEQRIKENVAKEQGAKKQAALQKQKIQNTNIKPQLLNKPPVVSRNNYRFNGSQTLKNVQTKTINKGYQNRPVKSNLVQRYRRVPNVNYNRSNAQQSALSSSLKNNRLQSAVIAKTPRIQSTGKAKIPRIQPASIAKSPTINKQVQRYRVRPNANRINSKQPALSSSLKKNPLQATLIANPLRINKSAQRRTIKPTVNRTRVQKTSLGVNVKPKTIQSALAKNSGPVSKTINAKYDTKMSKPLGSEVQGGFGLKGVSNSLNRTKELKSALGSPSKSKLLKGDSKEVLRMTREKSSKLMSDRSKRIMSKCGKNVFKGAKAIYNKTASEAGNIVESDNKDSSDLIKAGTSDSMKNTFNRVKRGAKKCVKKGARKSFSKLLNSSRFRRKLLNKAAQKIARVIIRLIIQIISKIITSIISFLAPYMPVILLVLAILIPVGTIVGFFIDLFSGSDNDGSGDGSSGDVFLTLEPEEIEGLILERGEITDEQDELLNYALSKVGYKYSQEKRYEEGYFDCSSFAFSVEKEIGKKIPSGCAADQAKKLTEEGKQINVSEDGELLGVSEEQLQIGDLIYYGGSDNNRYNGIHHVSVYVGNGYCVEAYSGPLGVIYRPLKIKANEPVYVFRP